MTLETTPWDPAARLTSPNAEAAYLEAALEDGDPAIIAVVRADIVRAAVLREARSEHAAERQERSGR